MGIFDIFKKKKALTIDDAVELIAISISESSVLCGREIGEPLINEENPEENKFTYTQLFEILLQFQFLFMYFLANMSLEIGIENRRELLSKVIKLLIQLNYETFYSDEFTDNFNEVFRTSIRQVVGKYYGETISSSFDFKSRFEVYFIEQLNNTSLEYKNYKLHAEKDDEGLKDTLLWEFGKKIAEIIDPEDILINTMTASQLAVSAMTDMKLNDIFRQIR